MNTRTITLSPQPLPMPVLLPSMTRLLLAQTNANPLLADDLDILSPEMLTLRATQITVLLHDMLAEKGYHHGGLNE